VSNCSFKYCQKTPTKVNGLTEVSAKGYLLIHKFLVHVKLKYCEWNKIIVWKLDSICSVFCVSVSCVVFHYRNCPFPFHGRFFFGGGGLRHLSSPNPCEILKLCILRPPPTSKFPRTFRGGGMVIFWKNTVIFLTGGCSDINGTVPHSLRFYHKKLVCNRMPSQNENPA